MPPSVNITFLGGLSDIGRNCAAIESDGKILVLDCGVLFANENQPGVDNILPDLDYLFDRADQVIGCVLTHAHQDHIGALQHLLSEVDCPLYGSAFTLGLVFRRLAEYGMKCESVEVDVGDTVKIGPFECEFLSVTHSVPGGHISAIKTPQGIILHSSDFKLDETPIDNRLTDIERIKELSARDGIRLLLADSTNSDQEGISASESSIQVGIQKVFAENQQRRIFVACFSSHLHRIQQIFNVAKEDNRKVVVMGLSMRSNVALGKELGILDIDNYLDIKDIGSIADGEICIITTGSQAEENSALAKAALGTHRNIKIGSNDTIVLSANAIPGNEARVYRMLNDFASLGAKTAFGSDIQLHTTGHGKRGELEALHIAVNPEWFVPVHGERRHLEAHKELAMSLGMPEENALLCVDGDQVEMTEDGLYLHQSVTSGRYLYSYGNIVSPDSEAIKERVNLSKQGVVQVVLYLAKYKLLGPVFVNSKGVADGEVAEKIHADIAFRLGEVVESFQRGKDNAEFAKKIKKAVRQELKHSTGRFPAIFIHIVQGKSGQKYEKLHNKRNHKSKKNRRKQP